MNPILEEINTDYLTVQDYLDPQLDKMLDLTPKQRKEFELQRKEARDRFNDSILPRFKAIVPNLTSKELIEGYKGGCKLLKKSIGGVMISEFETEYIQTMIGAIQSDDETGYRFLMALRKYLNVDTYSDLVRQALNNSKQPRTLENALALAYTLRLFDTLPKIQELAMNNDSRISSAALETLKQFSDLDEISTQT